MRTKVNPGLLLVRNGDLEPALECFEESSPLDEKAIRELSRLYVGNLPAGIPAHQLVQCLTQLGQAMPLNPLTGEPILRATMSRGSFFAFVEFRTAEEAANGLQLNGVALFGRQLQVCRPKDYTYIGTYIGNADPVVLGGPPAVSTRLPTDTIETHQTKTKTESKQILAQQTLLIQSNKLLAEPRERCT